jgi:PKHD-type hydroxylase
MRAQVKSPAWTLTADYVEDGAFFPQVFYPEECEKIIEFGRSYEMTGGTVVDTEGNSITNKYRSCSLAHVEPSQEFAWVYERLTDAVKDLNEDCFGFDLFSFGENMQFTQYEVGQHYDYHVDRIFNGPIRKLSIVLQLTDPKAYEGGDLEIYTGGEPRKLPRSQGTLIAFPSYVLHRVTPVTKGTRNSLVGWINGNPFR